MKPNFNFIGNILIILSIISFLTLLTAQFFNYNDHMATNYIGSKNNTFSLLSASVDSLNNGVIVLKNMTPEYNDVSVLINGEYAGDFTDKDEISIQVYQNDIVEIDGTRYDKKLKIKVVGISNNIDEPQLETTITTSQSIEILAKVRLK